MQELNRIWSTLCNSSYYLPRSFEASLPHPATQHRTPVPLVNLCSNMLEQAGKQPALTPEIELITLVLCIYNSNKYQNLRKIK